MEDDLFYLEPDFMPSTLRAVDLRSLLLQHNVAYPMRATKPELVAIFKERITANAQEIIEKHQSANSRPTFALPQENTADTWSSGDEAPSDLIQPKSKVNEDIPTSPQKRVKEVTAASPKRQRRTKKLPIPEPVLSTPPQEEQKMLEEPLVEQNESKASEEAEKEQEGHDVSLTESDKKETFAKPAKPAPRKAKIKKPRADRSWIKPKAIHSGLTSDSDSDVGDRQKGRRRPTPKEKASSFHNFMNKGLLGLPESPNPSQENKAEPEPEPEQMEQSQVEPAVQEQEQVENHAPVQQQEQPKDTIQDTEPTSPSSPQPDNLRRSLRIRRANSSKDGNLFYDPTMELSQTEGITQEMEASENKPIIEELLTTTYETVLTEAEADDEAEPSAIALAKGKQRIKKYKQKKTKKPSPRLCQLIGLIVAGFAFWYFVSAITLPKSDKPLSEPVPTHSDL
ncbi:hypothetical protein INT43_000150 [Umbelopsis isabellina]|uniref:HeH/LEM domain-containing protein n=1 Tax=Mortierella isabellina TaxID=91625 RepID=A0A8H7PF71_MORIS|nr:hypothetical protein INT43_000150 [Umbelopsis isabellina]